MKTILAPIDFSSATDAVLSAALSLARALNGRIVLLNVTQRPVVLTEYAGLMDNMTEIETEAEKSAARQLEALEERLKSDFVAASRVHVVGAPIVRILEQAELCAADYIVMGSHGHTAFYDLLVGSTTHGVLMRAKCPVVIVPASTGEKAGRKSRRVAATT